MSKKEIETNSNDWQLSSGKSLYKTMVYEWIDDNIDDTKLHSFMHRIARATIGFNKEWYGVDRKFYPTNNLDRSNKMFRQWQELGYIKYKKGSNLIGKDGRTPPLFSLGSWVFDVYNKCKDIVESNSDTIRRSLLSENIKKTITKDCDGEEFRYF